MSPEPEFLLLDGIKCYSPAVAEAYQDYPSEGFDVTDAIEDESFWSRSRSRLIESIVRRLTGGRGGRFLEIGCGTGTVARGLAAIPGLKVLASEVYVKGLRFAKQRAPEIEFIQLDATAMPFADSFDIVGAFDVIEHIDDDLEVLRGVHRALAPGGHVVLTVPQYQFMWSTLDDLVHHKRRYSRAQLLARLREAGFAVEYCGSFVCALFPAMLLSRMLDRLRPGSPRGDLKARVHFSPVVNALLDRIMRIDEALVSAGLQLPFGGSLVVVARK